MTCGIDIRVLARGTRTGVEEYTLNLLAHLLPQDQSIQYKLFYNAYHKIELNYPWLDLPNVTLSDFKIPNRALFVSARYGNWPKIDRLCQGLDVYFNPHFFVAPVSASCQKVITFHDLSFEHFGQFLSLRKRLWHKFLMAPRQEAEKAERIIAVSQSTKQDLINLYQIEPAKIKVIYSGIGDKFKPAQADQNIKLKYNLPDKFILYFGTLEPRKNLIGLIKAFELLRTRHQIQLVLAGSKGWLYENIFKTATQSKFSQDIFFTGFVAEEDKPALYNMAELFVYPSFFEGFGFPPLEAMACGIPTIVSHNSSLPEVVGQGAVMIDPYNIDELAWAMDIVLTDKAVRQNLKAKGMQQAKKFSWQRCAQETLEVLRGK